MDEIKKKQKSSSTFRNFVITATYRLDYTQMKQPGECPGTDKWSPASDNYQRQHHQRNRQRYNRYRNSYCNSNNHRQHHYYRQQQLQLYYEYPDNGSATAYGTLEPEDQSKADCRTMCRISVTFVDYPYTRDESFLKQYLSQFTVPGTLFTSSYLW